MASRVHLRHIQTTFASITCALIGRLVCRAQSSLPMLLFSVIWFHLQLHPDRSHGVGRWRFLLDGALDFAWRHRSCASTYHGRQWGAYMLGKRISYGKESMAPHNLALTVHLAAVGGLVRFPAPAPTWNQRRRHARLHHYLARYLGDRALLGPGEAMHKGRPRAGRRVGRGGRSGGDHARLRLRSAPWAPSSSVCWPASSACGVFRT
jgi:hypothetical protein